MDEGRLGREDVVLVSQDILFVVVYYRGGIESDLGDRLAFNCIGLMQLQIITSIVRVRRGSTMVRQSLSISESIYNHFICREQMEHNRMHDENTSSAKERKKKKKKKADP